MSSIYTKYATNIMAGIIKNTFLIVCSLVFSWLNVAAQEEAWVDMGFKDSHGNTVYWSNYDIGRKQDGTCDILRDTQSKYTWQEINEAIKGKDYELAELADYEQLIKNCTVYVSEIAVTYPPNAIYCDMPFWMQGLWKLKRGKKEIKAFSLMGEDYNLEEFYKYRPLSDWKGVALYRNGRLTISVGDFKVNKAQHTLTNQNGEIYFNSTGRINTITKTVLTFKSNINGATVRFVIEPAIEEDMGVISKADYKSHMNILNNVPINRFWIGRSTQTDPTKAYVAQLSEAGDACGAIPFLKTKRAKARPVKRSGKEPKTNVKQNNASDMSQQKDDAMLRPIVAIVDSTISVHPLINLFGQKMVMRVEKSYQKGHSAVYRMEYSPDKSLRKVTLEQLRGKSTFVEYTAERQGDKVKLNRENYSWTFSFEGTKFLKNGVHHNTENGIKDVVSFSYYDSTSSPLSSLRMSELRQYVQTDGKFTYEEAELNVRRDKYTYPDSTLQAFTVSIKGKESPTIWRYAYNGQSINDTNFNINAFLLGLCKENFTDLAFSEWLPCYGIKLITTMANSRFKYIYDRNGNIIRIEDYRGDNATPYVTYTIYYQE